MRPVALVGVTAFALGSMLAPAWTSVVAAKEGPLEHVGHGLLVLAIVAWAGVAGRSAPRSRERLVALGLMFSCALLLGEEIDWGGVYGWVRDGGNLHNAWHGASYLLFAVPVVGLVGVVGWRRGDRPGRLPGRHDALGLLGLGLATLVGTLVWSEGEAQLDEASETILYAGLVWMGLRGVVARDPDVGSA